MTAAPSSSEDKQPPPERVFRTRPHPLVEALAFLLPFCGALSQIRGEPLWRSDAAILAALEGAAGFQGVLTSHLSRLALALPLGSWGFRLALPGAVFCGLAGISVLHLCHLMFRKQGGYSRLDPWLALGASLSASFSLPWISEASVAGGGTVGAGLALLLVRALVAGGLPRTLFSSVLIGVTVGALASESAWAAGLVLFSALLVWPETETIIRRRSEARSRHLLRLVGLATSAALAGALLILPAVTSLSLGSLHESAQGGNPTPWPLWSPLSWIGSIGFLWTAGAFFALLFSLDDRRPLYALWLVIFMDWILPGNGSLGWSNSGETDPNRLSVHLMAIALVAPLGALGLRTMGESARALRLFAARPLAAMVAVLAIAGCLASAEDSLRSLSQAGTSGTQAWTDEALGALPDDALVLVKTPTWGRRLLAAQALGARPDVLVVPLADVTRPETLQKWLEEEPGLELLLRDLSVADTPSERALARLVDERPVVLEPDPKWDRRLLEHVLPTLPLARFSSHAVGRSDRLAALELVPQPRDRIVSGYQDGLVEERASKEIFRDGFDRMQEVLDVVKDGTSSRTLNALRPDAPPADGGKKGDVLAPMAAL